MPEVTVSRTINAPLPDVWAAWDDFGNIAKFNPNLNSSHSLTGSHATGQGATRQCNLADGKTYLHERIVEYVPQTRMVIDIYDGNMPVKHAVATLNLRASGRERTEVSLTMGFTPKFGLLGRMMVPMMKPQFRKMLNALLDGNANFVERGVVLNAA